FVARPLGTPRNSRTHDGLTIGVQRGQRFQCPEGFWRQNVGIDGFKIGTDLQLSRSHKLPPCSFTRHERRTCGALRQRRGTHGEGRHSGQKSQNRAAVEYGVPASKLFENFRAKIAADDCSDALAAIEEAVVRCSELASEVIADRRWKKGIDFSPGEVRE